MADRKPQADQELQALEDKAEGALRQSMRGVDPETRLPSAEGTYNLRRAEVLAILNLANAFRGKSVPYERESER